MCSHLGVKSAHRWKKIIRPGRFRSLENFDCIDGKEHRGVEEEVTEETGITIYYHINSR